MIHMRSTMYEQQIMLLVVTSTEQLHCGNLMLKTNRIWKKRSWIVENLKPALDTYTQKIDWDKATNN